MKVLRFLAILALAAWVGGLLALGGVAAPTLFAQLQLHQGAAGRELAGVVFGDIFDRFQYAAWGLGGVVITSLAARAALGPRPRRLAIRIWTIAFMLAASVATTWVIAPRIVAIRDAVHAPIESLPATDARRVTFGRLHGASSVLMLVTLFAGVGLLWAETRDD
jgi:hypothetical protein